MTIANKQLADRAAALAKGSDGLQRRAYLCIAVACGSSTTLDGARKYLAEIGLPDILHAAHALLDELANQNTTDKETTR